MYLNIIKLESLFAILSTMWSEWPRSPLHNTQRLNCFTDLSQGQRTMLKPKNIFGIILFFLFIYLFGYGSFCKYIRRNTIVIKTVKKTSDIPAPAVTLVPNYWKGSNETSPFSFDINPCGLAENFYDCVVENFTFPINDIVVDSTSFNWTSRFEPSQSMLFTLNPSKIKLSSKEALFIQQKKEPWPIFATYQPGDVKVNDPDFLPNVYLHDPKYFVFSTNPR